jgi:hypothetical protein
MRWARAALALLLFGLIFLPKAPVTQAQSAQWVEITPPGSMTGYGSYVVATDPSDPTEAVYVGTDHRGVHRSTDGGASWTKINTGSGGAILDAGSVWTLAIDPFNPSTLYAAAGGGGAGGPLKSTDGGVSWVHLLPGSSPTQQAIGTNDVYAVALDPHTPGHVLASFHYWWHNVDSGLIESFNGGATWTVRNPPAGGNWGAGNSVWFLNDSQTWLVGSQSGGIWRTGNGGDTWTKVFSESITHGGINALYHRGAALYLAYQTGIVRSTDDGETWQAVAPGLPYAYYTTVGGDGDHIYTAPSFPLDGDNGPAHGPWRTATEGDNGPWSAMSGPQPCSGTICNGPVSFALARYGTLYTANFRGGVWKLAGGGTPAPTATPATATVTPTSTVTPTLTATPGGSCYRAVIVGDGTPPLIIRGALEACP